MAEESVYQDKDDANEVVVLHRCADRAKADAFLASSVLRAAMQRARALQYVQMARTEGIGRLVLGMPVEDKRKFFKAAFRSITLDGYGRGLWRQRSVKAYELSDPLNTFILQHASA